MSFLTILSILNKVLAFLGFFRDQKLIEEGREQEAAKVSKIAAEKSDAMAQVAAHRLSSDDVADRLRSGKF